MEIYDIEKEKILSKSGGVGNGMSRLTDGSNIAEKVQDGYHSPLTEQFYGFGEHYGTYQQRGKTIDT